MGQFVVGIFTGIVMCMVARKYSIDYSLKKDKSVDPPKYLVFFRAKDVDVMTAASFTQSQNRPGARPSFWS